MEARASGRRTILVLVLACLLTLGLGFALKDACNGDDWQGHQFTSLCYHDMTVLFINRHLYLDPFPYESHPELDVGNPTSDPAHPETRIGFVEYPVLTGLLLWIAAALSTSDIRDVGQAKASAEFFYWNALILSGFAIGLLVIVWKMTSDPRRVLFFAASSSLVLYAFHNWDLMAVFLTLLGLYWWERGRWASSGVAFAAGASAKLFPAIIPPLLLVLMFRRRFQTRNREHETWANRIRPLLGRGPERRFAASFVGGILAMNVPILLLGDSQLFLESFRFHMRRPPNPETLWWVVDFYSRRWGLDLVSNTFAPHVIQWVLLIAFLTGYAAVGAWAWRGRVGARASVLVAILLFLLFNKFFSLQYALWVVPFFALIEFPIWSYALFAAADVWVYVTLLPFFPTYDTAGTGDVATIATVDSIEPPFRWVAAAIVARVAGLVALFVLALRSRTSTAGPVQRRANRRSVHLLWVILGGALLALGYAARQSAFAIFSIRAETVPALALIAASVCFFAGYWTGFPVDADAADPPSCARCGAVAEGRHCRICGSRLTAGA